MASGYLVNPAAMDGSMQLGMARGLSASDEERNAGARVPAGVAAFAVHVPGSMAQRRLKAVAAFDEGASNARSSISNHYLIDASVVGAALRGLEAKVMQRQAGGAGATSAAPVSAAPPEVQALYSLEWQAAPSSGDEGEASVGVALTLSGARPDRLSTAPIAVSVRDQDPLAAFAGGADLFSALTSAPCGVAATTSGAQPVLGGSAGLSGGIDGRGLTTGAFLGLLRTAAGEMPQLSLSTADADACMPSAGVVGAALAPAISRPLMRAGETYLARLLPSTAFPSVGCVQVS